MKENTCYDKLINGVNENGTIVFYGKKNPMRAFLMDVDLFAAALKKHGFEKGDVLSVYLPTSLQAIVAFYACSKIGVTANIVHPLMPLAALKENMKAVGAKGLMYYDATLSSRDVVKDFNGILIECSVADYMGALSPFYKIYGLYKCRGNAKNTSYRAFLKSGKNGDFSQCGGAEDIVVTMHSGGTDGTPKILKISNRALNALVDNLLFLKDHETKGEYSLVMLPVFHAFGLGISVHYALTDGYNLCLASRFNARRANEYIKRFNVTFVAGVPVMFKKMVAEKNFSGHRLKKLKQVWCGGDVLPENTLKTFDEKVRNAGGTARLMRGYGLSEVCGACAANSYACYKDGSVGKPFENTTIKIIGDDGQVLNNGEIGEILVSTAAEFSGYVNDGDCKIILDGKPFVKTGDLGYVDDDGYLFVSGRKKRTVKINAINVFPFETEEKIRKLCGVKDCAVVDFERNGKIEFSAYVVAENEKRSAVEKEIFDVVNPSLIKYARVRNVKFVEALPLTKMGKIDFSALKSDGEIK